MLAEAVVIMVMGIMAAAKVTIACLVKTRRQRTYEMC
jgi:hypothetical protein